jgi:trimethylamine:corrinoid methyltransferase-like protein
MVSAHTMKYMRKEIYGGAGFMKNSTYEKWVDQGSPEVRKRANTMVQKILLKAKNHIPKDMDNEIKQKYKILL